MENQIVDKERVEVINDSKKDLLTKSQYLQICKNLILFQYLIVFLHFLSVGIYMIAVFKQLNSNESLIFVLLASIYSILKTNFRYRFISGESYISAGVSGEVGVELPASTNYLFWSLWCAFELTMALAALILCVKVFIGAA